jgi:hypothetical protein
MVKLTLKEEKGFIPVAKIQSKDQLNGEILFLDPRVDAGDDSDDEDGFNYKNQGVDFAKYFKGMKPRDAIAKQNLLVKHLQKNTRPIDDDLAEIYDDIKADGSKTFMLKSGSFIPIPDITKERVIYYVFAPSGSGKTYFTASVLKQWLKLNPGKDVYVFSKLDDDSVLDNLGDRIKRINIDTLVNEPVDVKDIPEGSMVVFDDTDCIEDRKINEAILKLENSIYQVGRHYKISVIKTSHLGSDYKRTRVILTEASYIVVYPSSGSFHQIKYVLKQYLGFSTDDISRIKNLKSRWVVVSKHYPIFCLSENQCFLVN